MINKYFPVEKRLCFILIPRRFPVVIVVNVVIVYFVWSAEASGANYVQGGFGDQAGVPVGKERAV